MAADLQQQVANVSSIKPEIDTSQVFAALREMQTRVPQTSEQLASSLYDTFSSINATQEEGLMLVEKFARGATAAVTDAQTFGTAVIGVMNAYGEEIEKVDHIQDVFFNTVKNGVVTGAELATNLGVATQAAKNAGVDFDELGALIAGVTKEGGSAAQNINNLANTLMKLPTGETQKALRALKVDTVDLRTGGFLPILTVLTNLKAKLEAMPPAIRAAKLQDIFPDAQARTGLQTLLSQLDFIKTALKENQTEAGAAGQAYETMAHTHVVAAALQENAVRNFQQSVGETIIQNAAWVKAHDGAD
jgi:TP901 family phage tail tape measure protein